MSKFTAKVSRLGNIPFEDLCNLLSWGQSPLDINGENSLVAAASDEQGSPVAYIVAEPTLLVGGYAISSTLSDKEAGLAGDKIDNELANVSAQLGIARFLIILPSDAPPQPDERSLRYIERTISPQFNTRHLTVETPSPSVWIN